MTKTNLIFLAVLALACAMVLMGCDPNKTPGATADTGDLGPAPGGGGSGQTEPYITYYPDGTTMKQRIDFDDNGAPALETNYNSDGTVSNTRTFRPGASPVVKWYNKYDANGKKYIYEYDASGEKVKETAYNADGSLWYIQTDEIKYFTEYHDDGRKQITTYYASGSIKDQTLYNLDNSVKFHGTFFENGGKDTHITYFDDGDILEWNEWYENGNKKKEYRCREDKYVLCDTTWDEDGTPHYHNLPF